MTIREELDRAVALTERALECAKAVIAAEQDSDDDEFFPNAESFMANLLDTSEYSAELIKDSSTRKVLEVIKRQL